MKRSVSFTALVLFSATDAAAAFITRPLLLSSKITNTQLYDIMDYRKNSYAARKLRPNTIQSPSSAPEPVVVVNPEPVAAVPDPEPVFAIPEPEITIPEPEISIPKLAISIQEPVTAIPDPPITVTLPEPDVVENVVKEVTAKVVPTDRAPTLLEYLSNNAGSLRSSVSGGDSSTLLAQPISTENFDAVANAKEKLGIMKNNVINLLGVDMTKVETPDLTLDEDVVKKSIDSLKALGGLAAGAAAGTSDFSTVLHTIITNLQFEVYGAWYVAIFAVLLALGQRQAGLEEARKEFAARLTEADQKAAEAAKAATLAAEGAKMATQMANRIDANSAASILENSRLRESQVDKEIMQSTMSKLKAETEALKRQLAATEEQAKAEKVAAEKAMADKFAAEQEAAKIAVKVEMIAAEKKTRKKTEGDKDAGKAKEDKAKAAKIAAENVAVEKAKAEEVAAEKAKADKAKEEEMAAEKAKADKVAAENAAAESAKMAAEKAKADKVAAENAAAESAKMAAEKAKADKIAAENAAAESAKMAAEKAKADQAAAAEAPASKPEPASDSTEALKPKAASKGAKKNGNRVAPADETEAPKVVKKKASTIAAEKVNQAAAAVDPENPWKSLSLSTLKRKTAKDLTEYLEARGAIIVGENGKPKTKDELVAAVQNL